MDATTMWGVILDDLERDLDLAEGAHPVDDRSAVTTTWEPPTVVAPIPAALVARAQAIAARQRELLVRLPQTLAQTGQQLKATQHFAPQRTRASVYVDVSA
ncbi:hypothetical protein [Nocardioides sp.]|uniref:hypothetical protein n=1 Tax=Nocardioides sp. TaxID=35761 RepID=UPI002626ED4C|nr:hypothetical protein [Nocardioides sp.]